MVFDLVSMVVPVSWGKAEDDQGQDYLNEKIEKLSTVIAKKGERGNTSHSKPEHWMSNVKLTKSFIVKATECPGYSAPMWSMVESFIPQLALIVTYVNVNLKGP